jgi:hypothetical protein
MFLDRFFTTIIDIYALNDILVCFADIFGADRKYVWPHSG